MCNWDSCLDHMFKYYIFRLSYVFPHVLWCYMFQGGRKSGLFSSSTASLPAFRCLTPNTEDKDLTLRPSCTLGPDTAITADSTSNTGTTHHTNHSMRAFWFSCWILNVPALWSARQPWLAETWFETVIKPSQDENSSSACLLCFSRFGQVLSHTGRQTALQWSMSTCGGRCNTREEEGYKCFLSKKRDTTITWMEHIEKKDRGRCESKTNFSIFISVSLCDPLT